MIGELKNYQIDPSLLIGQLKSDPENVLTTPNSEVSKRRLKESAKELEALFFYEMLKELRKSTQGGLFGKGLGNDVYNSLFDMEMARLLAGRGIGLKEMILKQVGRRSEKESSGPLNDLQKKETNILKGLNSLESPHLQEKESKIKQTSNTEHPARFPVEGRISSKFGRRDDPFTGQEQFHGGIDIAAQEGQEIFPLKKGRVVFSGQLQGYGQTVIIDHEDGFISKYGHNMTNLVSPGDVVDQNQAIALVGNTGRSTGPHVHFEILYKGEKINPLLIVQKTGEMPNFDKTS